MGKTASQAPPPRQMADILRVPLKDQPWHFHQSLRAWKVSETSPPPPATVHPARPATGLPGWVSSLGLGSTDTQVSQAPHVTPGFLRFLPGGPPSQLGKDSSKTGIHAFWNWLQRQLAKQAWGCPNAGPKCDQWEASPNTSSHILATAPHDLTHTHACALLQTWPLRSWRLPGIAFCSARALPWYFLITEAQLLALESESHPRMLPIGPCTHMPEAAHHSLAQL